MKIAIYPGSFDPVTFGHIDIINRAYKMFDKLVVGVLNNSNKKPLFSSEERVNIIEKLYKDTEQIEVMSFDGLLIDFAHKVGAQVIVRGLRAVTDFDYELQLSQTNRVIAPDIDTIFLTTNLRYSYLSSSIVKEIASYGGDISEFVDKDVAIEVKNKIIKKRS